MTSTKDVYDLINVNLIVIVDVHGIAIPISDSTVCLKSLMKGSHRHPSSLIYCGFEKSLKCFMHEINLQNILSNSMT